MDQKYRLLVDEEQEFEFALSSVKDLDVLSLSDKEAHLVYEQESYSIEIVNRNYIDKNYTVKMNGRVFQVAIETPLDQLIKEMGLSLGSSSVSDEVYAPMPGIILEVHVTEGDAVKEGDYLCVLEAMKMENALTAPRDGVIKSVTIAVGDTVEKGKLLIEFEKDDQ